MICNRVLETILKFVDLFINKWEPKHIFFILIQDIYDNVIYGIVQTLAKFEIIFL